MKVAGFNFQKGKIRVAVLELAASKVKFIVKKIIAVDANLDLPEMTNRYVANFRAALLEFEPSMISARHIYDTKTTDASLTQTVPLGLLAFVCSEQEKPFVKYTSQALRSGKAFGLEKDEKPIERVDAIFGSHPPHWDEMQRTALLVAWRAILDAQ